MDFEISLESVSHPPLANIQNLFKFDSKADSKFIQISFKCGFNLPKGWYQVTFLTDSKLF